MEIALANEMVSKNLIDLARKTTSPQSGDNVNKVWDGLKPRNDEKKRECHQCGGNRDPVRCTF